MGVVQIWCASMLLLLGAVHAASASTMDRAELPAAPEPHRMFAALDPRSSSAEGAQPAMFGTIGHSKTDYTPPVDIFGKTPFGPFSHVAFGLKASTLGGGAEMATPLGNCFNLRLGGNFAQFQYPFRKDGLEYTPQVKLESGQGTLDYFPGNGNFHISGGALYVRNGFTGAANVPSGQTYKLGSTTYLNSIDDPVNGTATLTYARKVAPVGLIGFGNLIPRSGRRLSFPVEVGVAYLGAPQTKLKLNGTSCTSDGCFEDATDPGTLSNIKQEETEINNDLWYTRFYPVVSLGVAFRF